MVAGYTSSSGAGNNDVWLLKLNNDGTIAWQKTCGGGGAEYAYAMEQVPGGGYLVAGYTHAYTPVQNIDVLALKVDPDGDIVWQKSFGGSATDIAYAAALTAGGGFVLAGHTDSFGAGGKDVLVMRLSDAGDIVWQKVYGTSQTDEEAWSVQQTADGGFIVAGTIRDCDLGLRDMLMLKRLMP